MNDPAVPRVVHVVGARPNFPKAAPVLAALEGYPVDQVLVHTGQHYDPSLSALFLTELGLPEPAVNLGVGSGSPGSQTAAIITGLEAEFRARRPDLVVVYGDVTSTLAATIVASTMRIPTAHVEAGLRSFDRSMPEEINRLVTDRLAEILLVTSPEAIAHLAAEGVTASSIHLVGNPMIDTLLRLRSRFEPDRIRAAFGLTGPYLAATLHRPSNVDDPADAAALVAALHRVADLIPVVLPLHPRGRERLFAAGLAEHDRMRVVDPLGYLDFMSLVDGSTAVVTDSGGVQEETTVLGVPCLTLRQNTERPVTISHGTNRLVTPDSLLPAVEEVLSGQHRPAGPPPLWDGHSGQRIAAVLAGHLGIGPTAAPGTAGPLPA